jgi:deoxyribodipyrimidine photo-lyase
VALLLLQGGESEALKRLKHFLWDTDLIAKYFEIRNGMLGADYSTKFGPWLATGCLSPRTVHHQVRKYEQQRVANKSTYWVTWELTCRDWFRFYALKQGDRIFYPGGPAGMSRLPWSSDPELFKRWSTGTTGMPLVDANMRELAQTGGKACTLSCWVVLGPSVIDHGDGLQLLSVIGLGFSPCGALPVCTCMWYMLVVLCCC